MEKSNEIIVILMLGSYDLETKRYLDALKEEIVKRYAVKNIFPLLLDSVELFYSDHYVFMTERYEDKLSIFTFIDGILDDIIDIELNENIENTLLLYIKEKLGLYKIEKRSIIEKFNVLMNLSKLIFVVREKEETRGGEYLELIYALNQTDIEKIWFFYNKNIILSGMLLEFLDNYRVMTRAFTDENIVETVLRVLDYSV